MNGRPGSGRLGAIGYGYSRDMKWKGSYSCLLLVKLSPLLECKDCVNFNDILVTAHNSESGQV
jgi:hypothetical protein